MVGHLIEGAGSNQFDTVEITGTATLDGTLEIDASNLGTVASGTEFEIIMASDIAGEFDSVKWTGNYNNVYFIDGYTGTTAFAEIKFRGDMNGDDVINSTDRDLFALGLASPSRYFDECGCDDYGQLGGDFSGNGRLDFNDIRYFAAASGFSTAEVAAAIEIAVTQVPEPAAGLLLLNGAYILATYGNRRRKPTFSAKTVSFFAQRD